MNDLWEHIDLCSGIGGFSLGFQWAGLSEPILFCELDEFCQKILKKHWPDVTICNDVKELANDTNAFIPKRNGRKRILTSGFPCQPWSVAGAKRGKEDPRHIWPWIIEIVAQERPELCVFENVPNLATLGGLDEVIVDLANENYATTTLNLSAFSAAGAPHKRERLWIIAKNMADTESKGAWENDSRLRQRVSRISGRETTDVADTNNDGQQRRQLETRDQTIARQDTQGIRATSPENTFGQSDDGRDIEKSKTNESLSRLSDDGATQSSSQERVRGVSEVTDEHQAVGRQDRHKENDNRTLVQEGQSRFQSSKHIGLGKNQASFERDQIRQGDDNYSEQGVAEQGDDLADTNSPRGCSWQTRGQDAEDAGQSSRGKEQGGRNTQRGLGRNILDGLSAWMDEPVDIPRVATGQKNRTHRLKALGNAIVPQIAQRIGIAIRESF